MPYPDEIEVFTEKLNKRHDGTAYTVQEELRLAEGKYEGLLGHDNIVNGSVHVYSGPNMSGTEITAFTVSIPADSPWRRHIRVFAPFAAVYATYRTPGDQVDADDINRLQSSITAAQTEIERYKDMTDLTLGTAYEQLDHLATGKSDVSYVDTQLLAKADKVSIYTKAETDSRIQNIVAAAPAALDTLQEIAAALDNDPDFAGTMTSQLAGKVDKESGKGLTSNDYTATEKTKLAGIAAGANAYVHPSGDGNQHVPVTSTGSNGKVLKAGATAGSASWSTLTGADVGLGNVENYGVATQAEAEAGTASNKVMTPQRTAQAINSRLGNIGGGDMLKAIYDPDDDGKVAAAVAADSVPWTGVGGKPSSFTPAAHQHSASDLTSGTVPAARLPSASTSAYGITQLSAATNSTSTLLAATSSAVKAACDLASGKLSPGVTWGQLRGNAP